MKNVSINFKCKLINKYCIIYLFIYLFIYFGCFCFCFLQQDDDLGSKLHDYNQLMTENVEIRTEMKTMQLDYERLKRENEKVCLTSLKFINFFF